MKCSILIVLTLSLVANGLVDNSQSDGIGYLLENPKMKISPGNPNNSIEKQISKNYEDCNALTRKGGPKIYVTNINLIQYSNGTKTTTPITPLFSNQLPQLLGILLHSAVEIEKMDLLKDLINIGSALNVGDRNDVTPLYKALDKRNNAAAYILIKCGAEVNILGRSNSLLHIAAAKGSWNVAEKLIQLGAEVDSENADGLSPLYVALKKNKTQVTEVLLRYGANVNFLSTKNRSLLHTAVLNNDVDLVKKLMDMGAHVNTCDLRNHSALYSSIALHNDEIMEILKDKYKQLNFTSENGVPLLLTAVKEDRKDVVRTLIQLGANVSAQDPEGLTPLAAAVIRDNLNMIFILLENGVSLNEQMLHTSSYPIHLAIEYDSFQSLMFFLEFGDMSVQNGKGLTPFALAVYLNKTKVINLFLAKLPEADRSLDYCVSFSKVCCTPLHIATMEQNIASVENFIAYGANIKKRDKEQKSPIWHSAENNNSGLIDLLVSKGASIRQRLEFGGDTLLHVSVNNRCFKCVKSLLDSGADIDAIGSTGLTPLSLATIKSDTEIIKLLLSHGANAYFYQKDFSTPLSLAVTNGTLQTLQTFVQFGVEIDRAVNDTLLKKAVRSNKPEMVQYLLNLGLKIFPGKGQSLMRLGVKKGSVDAIYELMEAGLNRDKKGSKRFSSLLGVALVSRQPKVMEILLQNEADVNTDIVYDVNNQFGKITKSWSLLHEAAQLNAAEEADILLNYGADVNKRDGVSWTPLHVAALENSVEVAELLIRRGANVRSKTAHDYTPLDIARGINSNNYQMFTQSIECIRNNKCRLNGQHAIKDEYSAIILNKLDQ